MKKVRIRAGFLLPLLLLSLQSTGWELALYLSAALIHEAGHLLALLAFGYRAERLDLSLTGACMVASSRLIPYRKEILILLAGPAFNLLGCGAGLILLRRSFTEKGMVFFFCNALFCLFNLLPLSTLDGGRALHALLCLKWDPVRVEPVLSALSRALLWILFLGAGAFFLRFHNPSPLILVTAMGLGEKRKSYETS